MKRYCFTDLANGSFYTFKNKEDRDKKLSQYIKDRYVEDGRWGTNTIKHIMIYSAEEYCAFLFFPSEQTENSSERNSEGSGYAGYYSIVNSELLDKEGKLLPDTYYYSDHIEEHSEIFSSQSKMMKSLMDYVKNRITSCFRDNKPILFWDIAQIEAGIQGEKTHEVEVRTVNKKDYDPSRCVISLEGIVYQVFIIPIERQIDDGMDKKEQMKNFLPSYPSSSGPKNGAIVLEQTAYQYYYRS